ncbi:hypothetical protein BPAE_0280g00060 [Botrytis paeoniae]|uniref:Uncharacterized protein n=1 Tax=Botrytis paeoniae TaxID=278948 RepID=A0A4Z1FBC3_9HELO|nr:hypothetical protein BPAE_0280g00060 [Botrytis paeoniae]
MGSDDTAQGQQNPSRGRINDDAFDQYGAISLEIQSMGVRFLIYFSIHVVFCSGMFMKFRYTLNGVAQSAPQESKKSHRRRHGSSSSLKKARSDDEKLRTDDEHIDISSDNAPQQRPGSRDRPRKQKSRKSSPRPYAKLWIDALSDLKESDTALFDAFSSLGTPSSKVRDPKSGRQDANSLHQTLNSTIDHVKNRRWQYSRNGGKHNYRDLLTKVLLVFNNLQDVGTAITAIDPVISQPVWKGLCTCISLCLLMSQSDESVLEGTAYVMGLVQMYEVSKDVYYAKEPYARPPDASKQKLFQKTQELFSSILAFEASAARELSLSTGRRALRAAVTWNDFAGRLKKIQELDKACERLQSIVQSESISTKLDAIYVHELKIQLDVSYLAECKRYDDQLKLEAMKISSISDLNIEGAHNELFSKQQASKIPKGLSIPKAYMKPEDWFLKDVNSWIQTDSDHKLFWVYGKYGIGKTSSVSRMVDYLRQTTHSIDVNPAGTTAQQYAYFYVSQSTPAEIIRSLVSQLVRKASGFLASSLGALSEDDLKTMNLEQYCKELVKLSSTMKTIVVIDGIDECSDIQELVSHLVELLGKSKVSFKLLLTSNEGTWLQDHSKFPKSKCRFVKLDKLRNHQAILHYTYVEVKRRMARVRSERLNAEPDRLTKLDKSLVNAIDKRANGIFGWAEYQIQRIFGNNRTFNTFEDVEEVCKEVERMEGEPKFNEVYASILERNGANLNEKLIMSTVYKWLLASKVPLTLNILSDAVSVAAKSAVVVDSELVRRVCIDLIDVDDKTGVVRLAHPTVRTFLRNYKTKSSSSDKPYSIFNSSLQILDDCLNCLIDKSSAKAIVLPHDPLKGADWNFEAYAATFWPVHLQNLRKYLPLAKKDSLRLSEVIKRFLPQHGPWKQFSYWVSAWSKVLGGIPLKENSKMTERLLIGFSETYRVIPRLLSTDSNPLFVGCALGLPQCVEHLSIEPQMLSQSRNIEGHLAIFCAIENDNLSTVQYLITKIDLHTLRDDGNTVIHWIAAKGSVAMFKMVLSSDLMNNTSMIDGSGATVFHLAAGSAISPLEKIGLLEPRISELDANRKDNTGATALHHSLRGPQISIEVLKKLKELGVKFEAKDTSGSTALHFAARNPRISVEISTYLIRCGVNVDELDIHFRTPLSYLVADPSRIVRNTENIVQVFKTSISTKLRKPQGFVLHFAIINKNLPMSILKNFLPGKGEIINEVNAKGQTVLHCAIAELREYTHISENGSRLIELILHLLKNDNVDVDAVDKSAETACHYLARFPEQPSGVMAKLLLKSRFIDAANKEKETALDLAVTHCDWEIPATKEAIEVLIKKSNLTKPSNVLHRAISNLEHTLPREVFSLLLDKKADVNFLDKNGCTPLHLAVRWKSTDVIRLLIDRGAEVSFIDKDGTSMLHHAASRPDADQEPIKLLVDAKLKLNQKDNEGRRPIHFAARSGNVSTLKLLKTKGAVINSTDEKGNSILHYSVLNKKYSKEIIEYLVSSKAVHIDVRNTNGETSLMHAVRCGHMLAVETLLGLGTDISMKNKELHTALHSAAQHRKGDRLVQLLIDSGIDIDDQDVEGDTALHLVLRKRPRSSVICTLLRAKANTSIKNNNGETALGIRAEGGKTVVHHAAAHNSQETLKLVLKRGASINTKDSNGNTPLHDAARHGKTAFLGDLCMVDGLEVNTTLPNGKASLHIAAERGYAEIVNVLLRHKAAINARDTSGQTPLSLAIKSQRTEIVKTLLQNGAKCTIKRKIDGWTPLHIAVDTGNIEIARLLLDQYPALKNLQDKDRRTPATLAFWKGDANLILLFLESGAEGFPHLEFPPTPKSTLFVPSVFRDQQMRHLLTVSQFWQEVENNGISLMKKSVSAQPSELDWILKTRFERGGSALHLASEKAVKLLVERFHMPVDNLDDNGCTPLYWASATDETGLAKALVKAGANVNLANFSKSSPLHNAVENDRSKMVRFLLGCANVNIDAVDGQIRTPLNRAVQLQLVTITKILLAQENLAIDVKDDSGKTALDYARSQKNKKIEDLILAALARKKA